MTRQPIGIVLCVLLLVSMACSLTGQRNDDRAGSENRSASHELDGEKLFKNFGCSGCHLDSNQGPSLVGIYGAEVTLENGETVVVDDAYLRESILDPGEKVVEGFPPIMPSYDAQLDDEEVDALVQYIRSLN